MLKGIAFLAVMVAVTWSVYHVLIAAVEEKNQDSQRATGLYVAAILLILFGVTGAGYMFG